MKPSLTWLHLAGRAIEEGHSESDPLLLGEGILDALHLCAEDLLCSDIL